MKVSRTLKTSCSLLLICALVSAPVHAYDPKGFVAISGGFARLDQEVPGGYELTEDGDEAYEISLGWDISERWSLEINWADLGTFDYQRFGPSPDFEDVSLVSARFNAIYYLFGSQGYSGVSERLGFNVFTKFGGGIINERNLFSGSLDHDFDDFAVSYGIGAEIALNPFTYFRFQVQGFDDYLAFGSAAIMWRWGRSPR